MALTDVDPGESWAIVQRAQAGDTGALGELFARYHWRVRRFVISRVRDEVLADDLTGDVFVRMIRSIGSYQQRSQDFGAWLTTIARNRVVDHYKCGWGRHEVTTGIVYGEVGIADHSPEGMPEDTVIFRSEAAVVAELMPLLVPSQRRCVELRFLQERSVAEAAAEMGLTEGAVKTLQHRATRRLHRLITADRSMPAASCGDVFAEVP